MTKHLSASLALLGACAGAAQALDAIPGDLALADASACKKPRVVAPPPIREGAQRYNVRRRYVDLDASGTCVVMDFWVERLGGSDSWGARTLEHSFRHFYRGKWVAFETDLQFFPYLLRSPSTGQAYLVAAPDTEIDDIAGNVMPAAYVRGQWETNDPTMAHAYLLVPVDQGASQIYRTLAAQLAARTPADKQTPAERNRIRALQFEAGDAAADTSQGAAR
ncbi:hypothetical protein HAV22_12715 [Massilia sp. TW-1]|uniref:Uncharacterized protein n=1 Tax=Telluria antibiotica TaxID=2717319 RepID=A0ABX0PCG3_9BURK|nr:hypothetical protein [Telluria antibiotica]NIA54497.1 hypothetical protein [Telluria antibiotica]